MSGYLTIAKHYDDCFKKHGDCSLGVDWPNDQDALTRHKIMSGLVKQNDPATLLDFGCGLGHFYDFIKDCGLQVHYSGLDINPNFIATCKLKYPHLDFYCLDILQDDRIPNFDYIVCNGTFTEKLDLTHDEMIDFFVRAITKLWGKCNKGIAFNLMSKHVDWERNDLFHVSLDELGWILKNKLSRNFVIRNDYGLYEYTTYVYKQ